MALFWRFSPAARSPRFAFTGHWPLATVLSLHASRFTPPPHAPRPMPPAGNWLRFSGSIPPLFVLSPNMPTINTPSKLASFWRFCNAVGSLPCDSLATVLPPRLTLHPHASRSTPHAPRPPAGSGRARTLPRWLLPSTDMRIGKDRTGPDLDERSLSIHYVTESGDRFGQVKVSSPLAAAQPWGGMGHLLPATRETQVAPTSPWALFSRSTLGTESGGQGGG